MIREKRYFPFQKHLQMKPLFALTILMLFTIALQAQEKQSPDSFNPKSINPATVIWLSKPAAKWEEALPVGNGRLGAMIYGGVNEAIIQLNEDTYWSGGPYSTVHKGGHEKLKEIQQLVFDQKMLEAHNLFGRHLMGYPVEQQKYQSLGNLVLQFDHSAAHTDYKRWLDLETGVSGVEYTVDGKKFRQEILSSHPDQVIAIRITCSTISSLSLLCQPDECHRLQILNANPIRTYKITMNTQFPTQSRITHVIRTESPCICGSIGGLIDKIPSGRSKG